MFLSDNNGIIHSRSAGNLLTASALISRCFHVRNVFLDVSDNDINKAVWSANLTIENAIGEQQTLTVYGYEAS